MEINIERQFFEVGPFMSAVQQNLPDALTKRLPREVALNSAPMAIKIRPSQAEQIAKNVRLRLKISTCICHMQSGAVGDEGTSSPGIVLTSEVRIT
jgi:hypothetical protein